MPLLIHHFCLLMWIILMPGLAAFVFELKDGDAGLSWLWGFAFRFIWCIHWSSDVLSNEIACVCDNYPMFGLYMCLWSPSRGKNAGTFKNLVTWSMNGPTPGPSRLLNF
jgi:hypothetical protein